MDDRFAGRAGTGTGFVRQVFLGDQNSNAIPPASAIAPATGGMK
jgi:hypothetical protein